MARKFLYIVAAAVVLVLGALVLLRVFAEELTEVAFVPTVDFKPQPVLEPNRYDDPEMWISRPGLGERDPSAWRPDNLPNEEERKLDAAIFFLHPTSYLGRKAWNAAVDEPESRARAELFVKGMASPFNRSAEIWAPRYRQAALGAFLVDRPEAGMALEVAYGDILQAFDHFTRAVGKDRPIVLAGHSQGAYHLRRLVQDRIAGTPLAGQIAAGYVIGWPVSPQHDLPEMGLPACSDPNQTGCIMSWLSFAEPADFGQLLRIYATKPGLDGEQVGEHDFLCTNPLTGTTGGEAPATANLGALEPDLSRESGKESGRLVAGKVPARCGEHGFLYIGAPPELDLGPYVLPGNNYHLYDIVLFWANLREDVGKRVAAWKPVY